MNTDERRQLYENYVSEGRKKKIAMILFAVLLISAFFIFRSSDAPQKLPEETVPIEIALAGAAQAGNFTVQTNLSEDVCYWVRSTTDRQGFLIEMLKYHSESKNCIGELLNKTEIRTNTSVNFLGSDCICGRKLCELKSFYESNRMNLKIEGC